MTITNLFALGGGLGLFLYGMKLMGDGLERLAGNKLRSLLKVLTQNRFMGVLVGCLFTMVIQSSSATTVMVVGFVNAQLMDLMQATGVIMGANIGTTITGQLIAFKLTAIAPLLLLSGVVMLLFFKRQTINRAGTIVAGFGILFVGMDMMSTSMEPLRTMPEFISFMTAFSNPLLAVLTGLVMTSIIQSSSASVGILLALASLDLITLDQSVFLILGINIGTCVTALLSCIGTSRTAKRAAMIHLEFNIFGSALMLILLLLLPITEWVSALSPGDTARQIANAHTIFKIVEVVLFFPLGNFFVRLSERLVPGKDEVEDELRLKYVDERILTTPTIAVAQICQEVGRMFDLARENLDRAMDGLFLRSERKREQLENTEKIINFLNHEITRYLIEIGRLELTAPDTKLIGSLFHVVNDIERIGDHAENINEYASTCLLEDVRLSETGMAEVREMYGRVVALLDMSQRAMTDRDASLLEGVLVREEEIDDLEVELRDRHIARLTRGECEPRAGMIFNDVLSNLERVADHATNIAFSVQEHARDNG